MKTLFGIFIIFVCIVAYSQLSVRNGVLSGVPTARFNSLTVTNSVVQPPSVMSSTNITWTAGNTFTRALDASETFTFSGAVAGQWITVVVTASGNYTVTWPTVTWKDGVTPTQTSTKTDIYTLYYTGSLYYGSVAQNF